MTPLRDGLARTLMMALSLASLAVMGGTAMDIGAATPDALPAEAWRMFGYGVFAGLFLLLALFPRRMTGVWELVLFHKAGVAAFLALSGRDEGKSLSGETLMIVVVDLVLVAVTLTAYVLTQGWRAWGGRTGSKFQTN